MERQSVEDPGDASPDAGEIDELGMNDREFSSVEDVGDEPSESPFVDDV